MKHNFKILIIAAFLAIAPIILFAAKDNPPPHPHQATDTGNPDPGDGTGGPPVGPGGAPIGNGTFILLTLAAAYAGRKVYVMRTEEEVA